MIANHISPKPRRLYDIEICIGVESLKRAIHLINSARWELIAVTQNEEIYTVFFRRPAA